MLTNFFKKPLTSQQLADVLFVTGVCQIAKTPRLWSDGNEIFTQDERILVLLAHVYHLLEQKGLTKAQMELVLCCAREYFGASTQEDLSEKIMGIVIRIKDINSYFLKELPPKLKSGRVLEGKFLFEKGEHPIHDRMSALQYCIIDKQTLDEIFEAAMKRFKIADK